MNKKSFSGIFGNIFIVIYSLFILMPIYFVIITSLKTKADIILKPLVPSLKPVFQNFVDSFKGVFVEKRFDIDLEQVKKISELRK